MEDAARSQVTRLRAQNRSARYKVSIEEAARSKLSRFHAEHQGSDLLPASGAASVADARAPPAPGAELVAPAGRRSASRKDIRDAPTSTTGAHVKPMSASQRKALSARATDLRAAAGELEGKAEAEDQPRQKMAGTDYYPAYDVTHASPDGGGGRKLQSCAVGSGVTVTSSEFPLLEGCLQEFDGDFASATGAILGLVPDGATSVILLRSRSSHLFSRVFSVAPVPHGFTCLQPSGVLANRAPPPLPLPVSRTRFRVGPVVFGCFPRVPRLVIWLL